MKVKVSESVAKIIKFAKKDVLKNYFEVKDFFTNNLNSQERLNIIEWYKPFIYFEVINDKWKHYPCYCRALVSFDTTNGKVASFDSENKYQFARKGWIAKINRCPHFTGSARIYSDCGNHAKTTVC